MSAPHKQISLMKPLLPEVQHYVHYLQQIDQKRWYSNFGPLTISFEHRIAKFLEQSEGTVVTVSSGTGGLVNTLRAFNLPHGSHVLMPSWTFVATAASALAAGLVPYFIDVDERTWTPTPAYIKGLLKNIKNVGAVIVVAPFGSPLRTQDWDDFTAQTGVPVIIDAAAAFDAVSMVPEFAPGHTPIMVSMHATKVFGCGEGGFVVSKNKKLIRKIKEISNFGFLESRQITIAGTNEKMSEYTAAIAHSALDLWSTKREVWLRLKRHYIKAFKAIPDTPEVPFLSEDWVSSTCNVRLPSGVVVEKVIDALIAHGIESRQWWLKGCHSHPAYFPYPKTDLPVTKKLTDSVIALPFSIDLSKDEIYFITETLGKIVEKSGK